MTVRKVTQVGDSLGITFPIDMLKQANVALGDEMEVEYRDGEIVLKKSQHVTLPEGVDESFMELVHDVTNEHDEAFRGLVER